MVDRAVENFSQFFAWKIWQFKKSAYLCNRNQQTDDSVAQLVEQMTLNHWVESSSLSGVTQVKQLSTRLAAFFVFAPRASWFCHSRAAPSSNRNLSQFAINEFTIVCSTSVYVFYAINYKSRLFYGGNIPFKEVGSKL